MTKLDRFTSPFHELHFPDPQQKEPKLYSTCPGCGGDIFDNDDILEAYGMICHDDFGCLRKTVSARRLIAGDE